MQWLTGKSSSERKKKCKRFQAKAFFLQAKAYCVGPLFQVIYLVLSPSQAARSTIDPLDWNLSGTHDPVVRPTPTKKESNQQTNQEEGCVSGEFPQFRYIYVACLCWFRRITVPSCALRPSNYLWIIISSDNLPWMDTRTKIFLHKIDLTLSPPIRIIGFVLIIIFLLIFQQLLTMADFRSLPFYCLSHKQTRVGPTFKRLSTPSKYNLFSHFGKWKKITFILIEF